MLLDFFRKAIAEVRKQNAPAIVPAEPRYSSAELPVLEAFDELFGRNSVAWRRLKRAARDEVWLRDEARYLGIFDAETAPAPELLASYFVEQLKMMRTTASFDWRADEREILLSVQRMVKFSFGEGLRRPIVEQIFDWIRNPTNHGQRTPGLFIGPLLNFLEERSSIVLDIGGDDNFYWFVSEKNKSEKWLGTKLFRFCRIKNATEQFGDQLLGTPFEKYYRPADRAIAVTT